MDQFVHLTNDFPNNHNFELNLINPKVYRFLKNIEFDYSGLKYRSDTFLISKEKFANIILNYIQTIHVGFEEEDDNLETLFNLDNNILALFGL